jgi:uncharacterized membrane protein YuzA (DUF378 family)
MRGSAKVLGGSVNDAFVTGAVLGAVRYHERRETPLEALNKLLGWSNVSVMHFRDLAVFGEQFGTTNAASRIVYGLVGLAAIYAIGALLAQRRTADTRGPATAQR